MPGIVYVITNATMPGLVKIGVTSGDLEGRMRQLDNTSVPVPFECFYAAEVENPERVEQAIHEAFDDSRVRRSREFFRLSPDKPKAIIALLALKDVTPGQDVIAEAADQVALNEERKRKSNFRFSLVEINPGTVLQSVFDDNVTATVKSDRWVEFRGQEHSLSSSALEIAHEKGFGWTTIAGPQYWKYNGKTLSEIREESAPDE